MCSHSNTEIHGKRLVNDGQVSIWPWRRYDLKVALRFLRILEWLPLAAVVGSAHLCCLGGIRPLGGLNLKEIQKLGDQNAAAMSMFFRAYGYYGGHGYSTLWLCQT